MEDGNNMYWYGTHTDGSVGVPQVSGSFRAFTRRNLIQESRKSLHKQFPAFNFEWTNRMTKDKKVLDKLSYCHRATCNDVTKSRLIRLREKYAQDAQDSLSLDKTKYVIYAIWDIRHKNRLYIGQSFHSAFSRFKEHINCARKIFVEQRSGRGSTPFHAIIAKTGWENLRIFPLEQVGTHFDNDEEFKLMATPREIFWKRTLHAFAPRGFVLEHRRSQARKFNPVSSQTIENKEVAQINNQINLNMLQSSKTHKSISYILDQMTKGSFLTSHLSKYSAKNILKMHRVLSHDAKFWNADLRHIESLDNALSELIPNEKQVNPIHKTLKSHIVLLYMHRSINKLNIQSIIDDDTLWNSIDPHTRTLIGEKPRLAHKYAKPSKLTLCNTAHTASLTQKQTEDILELTCACHLKEFSSFIHPSRDGHVLTTDASIMNNVKLEELVICGSKFRQNVHENAWMMEPGSTANPHIIADLIRALETWRNLMGSDLGSSVAADLVAWCKEIIKRVKANPIDLIFPDNNAHINLEKDDLVKLNHIHKHFVISLVDKASNNYFIQCKKDYLSTCLKELETGKAYKVSDILAETLLEHGKKACNLVGLSAQTLARPSNFFEMAKLHTDNLKWRFVAGSPCSPLTPISIALGGILKCFSKYLKIMWDHQALKIPGVTHADLKDRTGFIIENTISVTHFIKHNQKPRNQRNIKRHMETLDFQTMYTMIPLDDLVNKISSLVTKVYEMNSVKEGINSTDLYINKEGAHSWALRDKGPVPHKSKAFSLDNVKYMISTQ
jgi:hypothetical protein